MNSDNGAPLAKLAEPISFTGKLTLEDNLVLSDYSFDLVIRRSIRVLIGCVSFSIAAILLWVGIKGGFSAVLIVILALCAYYPLGWRLHRRWAVRRYYRQHSREDIDNTATFTGADISLGNAKMDVRLDWDLLAFIVDCPKGLIFVTPPHTCWFFLPQRVFDGNDFRETILSLAEARNVKIRRMS